MSGASTSRLLREYRKLKKDPVEFVTAHPLEDNALEWHYVLKGPPDTPYEGGVFHGVLKFPKDYPFRPPSIWMLTPTCKFQLGRKICLTISGTFALFVSTSLVKNETPPFRSSSGDLESVVVGQITLNWLTLFHVRK